jgi:hypothetical protein
MAFDIRVVSTRDFLRATRNGELDLDSSRKLLADIVSECARRVRHHVLIDWRRTEASPLAVPDLFEVAADLEVAGLRDGHKVASLHPTEDELNLGRYFEVFAAAHGFAFQSFTDPTAALAWLAE